MCEFSNYFTEFYNKLFVYVRIWQDKERLLKEKNTIYFELRRGGRWANWA